MNNRLISSILFCVLVSPVMHDASLSAQTVLPYKQTNMVHGHVQIDAKRLVKNIDHLIENRKLYNEINGIYVNGNLQEWMDVIRKRQEGVNTLYKENKGLLQNITDVVNQTRANSIADFNDSCTLASFDKRLLYNVEAQLLRALYRMNFNDEEDYSDPFMNKAILELFLDDMEMAMPNSEVSMMAYVVAFKTYLEVGRAGYASGFHKAYYYGRKLADQKERMGKFSTPMVDAFVMDAWRRLLNVDFVNAGVMDLDALLHYWEETRNHLRYFETFSQSSPVTQMAFTKCQGAVDKFDLKLLSRVEMDNPNGLYRQHPSVFDLLAVDRLDHLNKKHKAETDQFYHLYCYLNVMLHRWTPQEGLEKINSYYGGHLDYDHIVLDDLDIYMAMIDHAISITALCNLDKETYNMYMQRYAHTTYQILKKCKHEVYSYKTDALVQKFLFNQHLMRYMTNDERRDVMNNVRLSTQLQSYAQTRMVSHYASLILESVIRKQPELLLGCNGLQSARDVRKHKKELMSLMDRACRTFDLGKILMMEIIKDDFRPLYSEEFDRIRKHPEVGLQFLSLLPGDEDLHDFVLSHHCRYNGMGGYPFDAVRVKSQYRTLIDILQLADCLDGATNKMGRNYATSKTFEEVLVEFNRDAGTLYNPDVVKLIQTDKKLNKSLSEAVQNYWVEAYTQAYAEFFDKMGNGEVDRW